MADVTISSLSISSGSGYVRTGWVYGETVSVGDFVYLKSDGKMWLADCLDVLTAAVSGIAIVAGAAEDSAVLAAAGAKVDITSGLTQGLYVLSEAGAMAPVADLAVNDYLTVVGIAESSSLFLLEFMNSGIIVV